MTDSPSSAANTRQRLDLEDTGMSVIYKMSAGNPGAVRVLAEMLALEWRGLAAIWELDVQGFYGSDIWVGYKDHCDQDVEVFVRKAFDHDPALTSTILRERGEVA